MACAGSPLESVPNEVLATVLTPFTTRELLPLVAVSWRLHTLVVGILHRRLLRAAPLPEHALMLECYHPSAKISTPYLFCRHIGLKTSDGPLGNANSPSLADLRRLYSSFRPVVAEENRTELWWSTHSGTGVSPLFGVEDDESATEDVYLEDGELFCQLCAVTNIVKEGPKRGLFTSHVNVSDGVIRVWRQWLAKRASERSTGSAADSFEVDDDRILWVGPSKSIGLRFRVAMGPSERMPLISGPGDEPPVSYRLVYEELLVRTTSLLLSAEQSAVQEISHSGKAIVIASM